MSKNKKRFMLCLMAILCFASASLDVWATNINIDEARERQREISEELRAAKGELLNTRGEIRTLSAELDELEYELSLVVDLLEGIKFDLDITRVELSQAEIDLENAIIARDMQFEAFVQRSRHIHMNGWSGYIDAIMNAESFTDFFNQIDRVGRIMEFDRNLVSDLQRAEAAVAEQVAIYQRRRDDLMFLEASHTERMMSYYAVLEQKIAAMEELEGTEAGQLMIIRQAEEDEAAIQRVIREHEAAAERARLAAQQADRDRAAAAAAAAASVAPDGQTLQWPLPGRTFISSPFGNRRDPIDGVTRFHSGVDVPAPMGTNIFAAESGTVIFSGWQGGFGNTVIIDHGNGKQTLYAHASSLLVRNGQVVSRGQAIARVGTTGRSTGNHLHFEVRINGSTVNPMNFTSPS